MKKPSKKSIKMTEINHNQKFIITSSKLRPAAERLLKAYLSEKVSKHRHRYILHTLEEAVKGELYCKCGRKRHIPRSNHGK